MYEIDYQGHIVTMTPARYAELRQAEQERDALAAELEIRTRQRDDARFIADRKHELIEKLYASLHELRDALTAAESERDTLQARLAATEGERDRLRWERQ